MVKSDKQTALDCIAQIDPGILDYNDWLQTGMALHHAGCSVSDWENWSRRDVKRYKEKDCSRKWNTFKGSGTPVTIGFLVNLCRNHGGTIQTVKKSTRPDRALDWNDVIGGHDEDDYPEIRPEYIDEHELPPCEEKWNGVDDLRRYLSTVFTSEEHVCYVTQSWQDESGKYLPSKGVFDRTAGKLISELAKCGGDIGAVIGDWNKECGAWIRFNPLDGNGICDVNITDYRYALVESDKVDIERQYSIYRELELPIAAMVHSAGKSLHAIVRVEAGNKEEYRKRVDYLYGICKKAGLDIDRQNCNPSRLSRLPGVTRNGKQQYLVATNIGKATWQEWVEWVEAINDDLPDTVNLADVFSNLPPLSESLIDGLLRQGHKMLLAGPSKAGKSFLLISLACAIAEGLKWLGWQCTKGRVMYVNLELDKASCMHRFKDVYDALGWSPDNIHNVEIWNLRGKAMPMDKLAPKLIRRAQKKSYSAVIIDPIYKVITGDENAADQMAKFCNQFDRVCAELGVATIYCHHHSKGTQGQKRAHDRSSGSGVFARDPDALVDMIELELDDKRRETIGERFACEKIIEYLTTQGIDCNTISQDDQIVLKRLLSEIDKAITLPEIKKACEQISDIEKNNAETMSAWRIEGILREFRAFKPKRMFFRYPVHLLDGRELLTDALAEGELPPKRNRQEAIEEKKENTKNTTLQAFEALKDGRGMTTLKELAEYLAISEYATRKRIKQISELKIEKGFVMEVNISEN